MLIDAETSCGSRVPLRQLPSNCTDASAVDVLHHDVQLSLRLSPPSLTGRGTVRIRARRETLCVALDAKLRVLGLGSGPDPKRKLAFDAPSDRLDGPAGE